MGKREASAEEPPHTEAKGFGNLSLAWQLAIGGVSLLVLVFSFLSTQLFWVGPLLATGIWIGSRAAASELYSLLLFVAMVFIIILQPERDSVSLVDIVSGGGMLAIMCWWVFRSRLLSWKPFAVTWEHLLLIFYFVFVSCVGIGGMLWIGTTSNDWLREILVELPIVIVPFLFIKAIVPDSKRETYFLMFLATIWVVIAIVNIVQFRSHVLKAVYFYQTGRAMTDPSSSVLLLFATLAIASIEQKVSRLKWYVIPFGLASVGILLSGYRTIWVSCILSMLVMFWMSNRSERRKSVSFYWRYVLAVIIIVVVAFFRYQLIHLIVLGFVGRVTSTTNVRTDASLVNRYYEWQNILVAIKGSPLLGYGAGGQFFDYNWILGTYYFTGYSHNMILYILLKSGIIGFGFVAVAYGATLVRGFRLLRSKWGSKYNRAIIRVAFGYLLYIIPTGMTLNTFAGREALTWQAIAWSVIWAYDMKRKRETTKEIYPLQPHTYNALAIS